MQSKISNKTYLLVGPTNHGKSTLIKYLANLSDWEIEIGTGDGLSTTNEFKIYKSRSDYFPGCQFIDSCGFNHNTSRVTDEDIRENLENAMIKASESDNIMKLDGIIIVESVAESLLSVRRMLDHLTKMWGTLPIDSILVVFTKKELLDELYPKKFDTTTRLIEEILAEYKVPKRTIAINALCDWRKSYKADAQILSLQKILGSLKEVEMKKLQEKIAEIKKIAQYYQKNFKIKEKKSFEVTKYKKKDRWESKLVRSGWTETVTKYRTEYKTRQESYWEEVPVVKKKKVKVKVPVQRTKSRGGIAGLFGGEKTWTEYIDQWQTKKYTDYEYEQYWRTVTEPVVESYTDHVYHEPVYHTVKVTDTIPYVVTEEREVEVERPFSDCWNYAKNYKMKNRPVSASASMKAY